MIQDQAEGVCNIAGSAAIGYLVRLRSITADTVGSLRAAGAGGILLQARWRLNANSSENLNEN